MLDYRLPSSDRLCAVRASVVAEFSLAREYQPESNSDAAPLQRMMTRTA
jgi:hypothetical protein